MSRDIEIFVQAFWVKCRDVIRPELDRVIHELEAKGHVAHVSTQEYAGVADGLAGDNPTLTLTLHPNKAPTGRTLKFRGDVARRGVDVIGPAGTLRHYGDLSQVDDAAAHRDVAEGVAALLKG